MMRRLLLALLISCGGGATHPAPKPISNRETGSATTDQLPVNPAQVISHFQSGGVIELAGDREQAMAAADKLMTQDCGGPNTYTITQEGEEAIGTDTSGPTPRTETAWRVHYACTK